MRHRAAVLSFLIAIAVSGMHAQEARREVAAADPQVPEPVIDASTDALLESSLEEVRSAVPESARKNFEASYLLVVGDLLDQVSDFHEAVALEKFRAGLHGKSAGDIAVMAELIARRLQDEERKVTAANLPGPPSAKRDSLACEALLSTSIAPARSNVADAMELTEESAEMFPKRIEAASSAGKEKLAVEIKGQVLRFITAASVEAGETSAAEFQILKNTPESLYAVDLREGTSGATLSSFVLNKKAGLAIWTKSRPAFLMLEQPDTRSHYLRCR